MIKKDVATPGLFSAISIDQLRELIRACISDVQPVKIDTDLLTVEEVAGWLKLSKSRVYALVNSGEMPSLKLGSGSIRFDRQEVTSWMKSNQNV
jgi:PTS system nitrogen regulatory IIA component